MEFDLEKISFDELIKEYSITNTSSLKVYLKEVWRYYELPGLICDRIFAIFDTDKNHFLSRDEFIQGLLTIFSGNYAKLTLLIFKIYDFENTGFITREDVRTILSHITIKSTSYNSNNQSSQIQQCFTEQKQSNPNTNSNSPLHSSFNSSSTCSNNFKFEKETFQDRLESQEELHSVMDKCFKFEKKIDFTSFTYLIENLDSNIFVYLLIFLLEKRPFTNKTLENYKFIKSESEDSDFTQLSLQKVQTTCISPAYSLRNAKSPSIMPSNKLLASPTLLTKFMPTESISKSPIFQRKRLSVETPQNANGTEGQAKNSLSKYLLNPSDKNSSAKKNGLNYPSDEAGKVPVSRTMKKNYAELHENKNMFLQHLGVDTHKSFNMCEESDVSSTVSNSEQLEPELMDGPQDIKMKIENTANSTNSNAKKNNNPNRIKSIEEKEIKVGTIGKEKVNAIGSKLLNLENLQQKTNNPKCNGGSATPNCSSNPSSARGSKMDENTLYPSKKYEGDVNYINQKIYQASLINQKLAQEKKAEKNKTSNKNITLKIPDANDIRENFANLDLKNNLKPNSENKSNINCSSNSNSSESSRRNSISIDNSIYREGYLYKITYSNKLKKLFFKLTGKDFYYYKSNKEEVHKGMHNITGVFIKEEKKVIFEDLELYCFSLVYPYRVRKYYSDNLDDYLKWIADLKKVIGYENLEDQYELKDVLGKGKFGLVKLAIHKATGRKVAVKIIGKKNIDYSDLEMIKNEIEILKVCQHPHIVKLFDVFENSDFIYLITEFLEGGDLFSYLQKRNFKLPETRVANLIHQICIAVYYLNSYGIVHRDLKPENLVMTDNTDDAKVKILDFGLSKIIGPNELCHDPFGTIAYCAPEILLDQLYTKKVDSWSIGVITYLMLCGFLPFDHESSIKEIARKTVQDRTPFPIRAWKDLSEDARKFVDELLTKTPEKRLSVSDALEHPFFRMHVSGKLTEIRKVKKKCDKFVFDIFTTSDIIEA